MTISYEDQRLYRRPIKSDKIQRQGRRAKSIVSFLCSRSHRSRLEHARRTPSLLSSIEVLEQSDFISDETMNSDEKVQRTENDIY